MHRALSGGVDVTPNGQLISKTVNLTGVRRLTLIATTSAEVYAQAMFSATPGWSRDLECWPR